MIRHETDKDLCPVNGGNLLTKEIAPFRGSGTRAACFGDFASKVKILQNERPKHARSSKSQGDREDERHYDVYVEEIKVNAERGGLQRCR